MSHLRFGAMIATSTVVMFGLMYLNTFALDHVAFSETRATMAVLMGATMAVIMMGYMFATYPSRRANLAIIAGAVLVFALALFLVRSQATVGHIPAPANGRSGPAAPGRVRPQRLSGRFLVPAPAALPTGSIEPAFGGTAARSVEERGIHSGTSSSSSARETPEPPHGRR
jgi:hypothetical protein